MQKWKILAAVLITTTWLSSCISVSYAIRSIELEKDILSLENEMNSKLYHMSEENSSMGEIEPISAIPGEDLLPIKVTSLGDYKISYYCPCEKCCGKDDGITASGVPAVEGITVACEGLPFGTKLMIDGALYTVQDRFGASVGNRIDVFVTEHERAKLLGTHTSEIYLVEVGDDL